MRKGILRASVTALAFIFVASLLLSLLSFAAPESAWGMLEQVARETHPAIESALSTTGPTVTASRIAAHDLPGFSSMSTDTRRFLGDSTLIIERREPDGHRRYEEAAFFTIAKKQRSDVSYQVRVIRRSGTCTLSFNARSETSFVNGHCD